MKRISILMIAVLMSVAMFAQQAQPAQQTPAEKEAAFTKTLTDRAQKIVDKLGLKDAAQSVRVRDIIVEQYRNLSKIHDGRDAQVKALKADKTLAKEVVDAKVSFLVADADAQLYTLHGEYLGKLYSELTADQVVAVKDAMTYNKVNVTMTAYKAMMLKLTDEQKRFLMASLCAARERAMDAESAAKKDFWFGKYKGRINNYLAKQGYDMKAEEAGWFKRMEEEKAKQQKVNAEKK